MPEHSNRRHHPEHRGSEHMRVLVFSSYYWPESAGNAPYVTGAAEHLATRGHAVTVATGFPHYPDWRGTSRGLLGVREQHRGVELVRRRHYVPAHQSARSRALYEASLFTTGLTTLPRQTPDAIVGISPTLAGAVLARVAASRFSRPYGLVFQDLQGPGALQSGVEGGRRIATFVERAEVGLARGAAAIGVIASGFRAYFEAHGIAPERIHDLPNWSLGGEPTSAVDETRRRFGWAADEFICLHAGNMGHKQGLDNVLRAAALMDDPAIRIVLAGGGNEREKLEALAAELGLANVSFLPSQPTGDYESMLRAADVLLVNQRSAVGEMSLASKLTSYFMAARPVVAAVAERSETARELVRSGAGELAPPEDPRALAELLARFKVERSATDSLGMRGRRYAEAHLASGQVLSKYEDFVRTVERSVAPPVVALPGARPWETTGSEPEVVAAATSTSEPGVSVIIVSYNCLGALTACLESLEVDRSELPAEIVVVDNASTDGTPKEIAKRFPWVRLIVNRENAGFARALNQGLSSTQSPFVLALNPDTIVPPGSVARAIAELRRHPDVGMLGVKLVRPDGTFDHACKRGYPTISSALFYFLRLDRLRPRSARLAQYTAGELGEDESGFVDAINGAYMLVRREAVADVGALDERYWLYAEDLDWCHRFWERGWRVLYWPGVAVTHWKGGSAGDVRSWTLNRVFHRSMWLFYEKHHASQHGRIVSALVWTGIWAKLTASAVSNAFRRPPAHDWFAPPTRSGAAKEPER